MVNALIPLSTKILDLGDGTHLVLHEVNYTGQNDTIATDVAVQRGVSGTEGCAFHLAGGTAPTIAVGAPSSGAVSITIGGTTAGTTGRILVVVRAVGNTSL